MRLLISWFGVQVTDGPPAKRTKDFREIESPFFVCASILKDNFGPLHPMWSTTSAVDIHQVSVSLIG